MVQLITENGLKTEFVEVYNVMKKTFPLRCAKEPYTLVYPDGYSANFKPPI